MIGGHGHVYPRPDGNRARCGGPGLCPECSEDLLRKQQEDLRMTNGDPVSSIPPTKIEGDMATAKNTEASERVRDISEKVYRIRLGADDTRRMIEKDGDNGEMLRNRAASYDPLTRAYLKAFGVDVSDLWQWLETRKAA